MPSKQYVICKGLDTFDALLNVSHVLQVALERGSQVRLVQTDLSAEFDRVDHLGLLYKHRSVGVAGSLFSVIDFLNSISSTVWWLMVGSVF